MTLPVLISIVITVLFGAIAIIFSIREEKAKKLLLEREKKLKQRIYETTVLKQIQDRIGYELDIEKIIDVITESLKNLFSYSTASSLLIKEEHLVFKTYVEESVSRSFIERVKSSMLASLTQLTTTPLPQNVKESLSGAVLNDTNLKSLNSFFHIPLIVNNNIIGLINISSTESSLYREDEMTVLYQITEQASNALSKLQTVLTTEKGKLMAMIGSLADGIFMIDLNNQLLVINFAAKDLLKIQKENPTFTELLDSLPKNYDFSAKIKAAVSQNIVIQLKEIIICEKTVQAIITPVVEEKSAKVIGASVLLHDITLEKNLLLMKEDFTNIIVHELRAPLTAIKGASDLIEKSSDQIDQNQQKKLLHLIHEQSIKLLEEINSVLDAAKLKEGRFPIKKIPYDLKKVVNDTVQIFMPQAMSKHIVLTTHFPENLPVISFDPLKMGQVINNLLSNSIKFTLEGGKITVSLEIKDPQFVTITVADTGIGIAKEHQKEAFIRFSQLNRLSSDYKYLTAGTGLGLYIVKGVVEAHGGTVSLESEVGQGTKVSFTLPITN